MSTQPARVASASSMAEGRRQLGGPQRRFEIRCDGCAYGGVVGTLPDRCPMCGGSGWETVAAPGLLAVSSAVGR
jgi:hypothetical protein